MNQSQISLYFHIPFCTKKCDYCHFYVLPDREPDKDALLEGFKLEWEQRLPLLEGKDIVSIYFGGGTPSLMGPQRITEILDFIQKGLFFNRPTIEITLEANPENITRELMHAYAQAGINRLSIGVQTLNNDLLKSLGRVHNAQKATDAVHTAFDAGIKNISIDLMYDLPNQTLNQWQETLTQVCKLPITHLSLYNLTIEPHTVFFKHRDKISKQVPDEETSLRMYQEAIEQLEKAGLIQYEISAFAKNDFYSKHNTGYWLARPFLGFGPSAFSYWEGRRFRNIAHQSRYLKALHRGELPTDFDEELDPQAKMRELLVIELRLLKGVNLDHFQKCHGTIENETLNTIEQLVSQGFLQADSSSISLTKRGVLFYDTIASELI